MKNYTKNVLETPTKTTTKKFTKNATKNDTKNDTKTDTKNDTKNELKNDTKKVQYNGIGNASWHWQRKKYRNISVAKTLVFYSNMFRKFFRDIFRAVFRAVFRARCCPCNISTSQPTRRSTAGLVLAFVLVEGAGAGCRCSSWSSLLVAHVCKLASRHSLVN